MAPGDLPAKPERSCRRRSGRSSIGAPRAFRRRRSSRWPKPRSWVAAFGSPTFAQSGPSSGPPVTPPCWRKRWVQPPVRGCYGVSARHRRRLPLQPRAGPRVRCRDALTDSAASCQCGHRGDHDRRRRPAGRESPNPGPSCPRCGRRDASTRFSIGAARAALAANAPEEAIRLVEAALGAATTPTERVALLRARDDALAAARRPEERLESIAELSALAEAAGDVTLEMDVMLRRAAALRAAEQQERAAELARAVRTRATGVGDRSAELAACMELGQDLMRATIGEGFTATPLESDLDGAQEAYARAAALAEELGDRRTLAHATRELGVSRFRRCGRGSSNASRRTNTSKSSRRSPRERHCSTSFAPLPSIPSWCWPSRGSSALSSSSPSSPTGGERCRR